MEFVGSANISEVLFLRCDYGEDLLESIEAFAKEQNIENGVVVSGIATVSTLRYHRILTTGYPSKNEFLEIHGPIEISSLQGVIAAGKPHLHVTAGDLEQAYSGHLEPGSVVLYLAEIVILRCEGIQLDRLPDPEHGVRLLRSITSQ